MVAKVNTPSDANSNNALSVPDILIVLEAPSGSDALTVPTSLNPSLIFIADARPEIAGASSTFATVTTVADATEFTPSVTLTVNSYVLF